MLRKKTFFLIIIKGFAEKNVNWIVAATFQKILFSRNIFTHCCQLTFSYFVRISNLKKMGKKFSLKIMKRKKIYFSTMKALKLKWTYQMSWGRNLKEYRWMKLLSFLFLGLCICIDFDLRNQKTKKQTTCLQKYWYLQNCLTSFMKLGFIMIL